MAYEGATAREYYGPTERVQTGKFQFVSRGIRSRPGIVINTKLVGLPANLRARKTWTKRMERAAERGVRKAVEYLLEKTLEITPEDTGVLKSSGYSAVIEAGKQTVGIVGFTSEVCPYAIYVHEDLTKNHKPPTMAKFLSRTQWKERGQLSRIIREEVEKAKPQ